MARTKKAQAAPAQPAQPAIDMAEVTKPTAKLERLSLRDKLLKLFGWPLKDVVTSREAGYIDVVVSKSLFPSLAAFVQAVQSAVLSLGHQFTLQGEASETDTAYRLAFTNPAMQAQLFWGARQNSRQDRVRGDMTSTPAAPAQAATVAPASPAKAPRARGARKAASKQAAKV